jgi:hypothetical protein
MGWSEPERACLAPRRAKVRNESLTRLIQNCQLCHLATKICSFGAAAQIQQLIRFAAPGVDQAK